MLRSRSLPLFVVLLSLPLWLAGCHAPSPLVSPQAFSLRVETLLGEQAAVTVPAGRLTDIVWQRLCFQRAGQLQLTFHVDATPHQLSLPYEDFFVDEGHVANSLDATCMTPADLIVLRRKYPGSTLPVVFHAAPAAAGD